MNLRSSAPHFAGSPFGDQRHVCAFFHNSEEKYRVLLPFIKDGFECGDRAFHVVGPDQRKEHIRRLESVGIDVAGAESSGQLRLSDWNHPPLDPDGNFDQRRMLDLFEEELKNGATQGFRVSRSIGHMEWTLQDPSRGGDLVEFCARLNYILPQYKDPVICVYDVAKFGGAVVMTFSARIRWLSSEVHFRKIRSSCHPMSFCENYAKGAQPNWEVINTVNASRNATQQG